MRVWTRKSTRPSKDKEAFMAKHRNAAPNNLANKLSWFFALVAFVCISACGGARNQAESHAVAHNNVDRGDSPTESKPAGDGIAHEVLYLPDMASGENGSDSINVIATDSVNAIAADSETAAPDESNRPAAGQVQGVAENLDTKGIDNAVFQYTPFSEAEIGEVVKNPLTLDDCIRIALGKNIALRLAKSELTKVEATHAGSYGKFLPTFNLQGGQENIFQKRPFDALAPTDPTRLNFNNNFLVGEMQQILPTGAVLSFLGDVRRDLNSPDRLNAAPTRTENFAYM